MMGIKDLTRTTEEDVGTVCTYVRTYYWYNEQLDRIVGL